MDKVSGPLGPRRRVAVELKRLREKKKLNLADVAGKVLISTSKLSRLENAPGKPRWRDVRDLIRFYGIEEGTALDNRLSKWVTSAQIPGWWTDYDELPEGYDRHLAYEADAAVERVYTIPFIPALLQTDAYTEAVFRNMERRSEDEISQLMKVRRKRKEALAAREDLPPLRLVAVTHESALRQAVGAPQILRDQLDALLKRLDQPEDPDRPDNVSLHILPFSARPVRTMTCMYAYFEYDDPEDLEQDVAGISPGLYHLSGHPLWAMTHQPGVPRISAMSGSSWRITATPSSQTGRSGSRATSWRSFMQNTSTTAHSATTRVTGRRTASGPAM
jgi:transcriptional regulator with XRE-family HTH domain